MRIDVRERVTAAACRLVAGCYMGRPEMADFLHTKYFTLPGLLAAARNELAYRRGRLTIPEVRMVATELTSACNLRCSVCPVNNGMKRPKGFMDEQVFRAVLEENRDLEIVQLCLWGEPLLHPRLLDFIRIAVGRGIRAYLYTNGALLDDPLSVAILESGLHRIFFSADGFGEIYSRIRGYDYGRLEARIFRFLHLRERLGTRIRVGVAMVACDETAGWIGPFRERWEGIVDEVQVTPHITHAPHRRRDPCRLLWLGYPIVLWDGSVVPCCVDYEGTLSLGHIGGGLGLKAIWNGERAVERRREHMARRFEGVCGHCHEYRSPSVEPRFER